MTEGGKKKKIRKESREEEGEERERSKQRERDRDAPLQATIVAWRGAGVIITGALWDLWEQRYNELSGVGEGGKG